MSIAIFLHFGPLVLNLLYHSIYVRLLDVCHGQLERERQLVLFLVFEHLEEDLAGYLNRMGDRGMAPKTIQVFNYSTLRMAQRK